MARVFRSLSGVAMNLTDEDRVLCTMMDVRWRTTRNALGQAVIGPENALAIKEALLEEGFEIVRSGDRNA